MPAIALLLLAVLATYVAYDLWRQLRTPSPPMTAEERREEWDAGQY